MSKLEKAVAGSGNTAFSMTFGTGFPAEILSETNPFSDGTSVVMGDIIHPDDYQPFCEVLNEIVNGTSDRIKVHARILAGGEYKWYFISAFTFRRPDGTVEEMDGMMFDVSDYLDCDGDDAVMLRYKKLHVDSLNSAQQELTLWDILGDKYLSRIQKPFTQIHGLFSAITDKSGRLCAIPSGQDKKANLNKMNFQRKKDIVIRHHATAVWHIAGASQEIVDENAQLLDTMVETVSGIANSFVVLGETMEDSQNANKLLGQNIEDTILINNIYSLILQSSDTKSAIGSIIPLISDYFSLSDILFCADDSTPIKVYRWDSSGMLLPVINNYITNEQVHGQLDYSGVVCVNESELHDINGGIDRSCVLSRTYQNRQSKGVIVYISRESGRLWSNRDRKQLKNITQILSTVIYKSFTEDELAMSKSRLERLAYYDVTTNIPNRSMFERDFKAELDSEGSGAVIAVEMANMKSVSEIYGCKYADDILKSFAEYISAMPSNAVKKVYRFSNDILLVTLSGASRDEALQLAKAFLTKFRSPWYLHEREHNLEVYAGVTIYPTDAYATADCIKAINCTLRLAKERQLNDALCYSEGLEESLKDNQLVKKLVMDSAENNFTGFYFLFQPVINLDTGTLHCCEANLFWRNENIIISRERYLPIIARMGLSDKLHGFVVDKICAFCASVRSRGYENFRVSIAVPEEIIGTDTCVEELRNALLKYSLKPNAISIAVSNEYRTLNIGSIVLKRLAAVGVNIIACDKGDSFFSPDLLERDEIKTIKIHSSRFTDNQVSAAYMRSFVKSAHEKGVSVCVNGVDSAEVYNKIKEFDVSLVEGIYNGRPLHSDEFLDKLPPAPQL